MNTETAGILNGWKEVAGYLHSSVRSVQRWERVSNLPIRRVNGSRRSAIFAFPAELDTWLRHPSLKDGAGSDEFGLLAKTELLISESKRLRMELRQRRVELHAAVNGLSDCLVQCQISRSLVEKTFEQLSKSYQCGRPSSPNIQTH